MKRVISVVVAIGTSLSIASCVNPMSAESIAQFAPIKGRKEFMLQAQQREMEVAANYVALARCHLAITDANHTTANKSNDAQAHSAGKPYYLKEYKTFRTIEFGEGSMPAETIDENEFAYMKILAFKDAGGGKTQIIRFLHPKAAEANIIGDVFAKVSGGIGAPAPIDEIQLVMLAREAVANPKKYPAMTNNREWWKLIEPGCK